MTMTPVGSTARWIAAARALESESAAPLFVDPYARPLAGPEGFQFLEEMRRAMGPTAPSPDPDLDLSLRTRLFDDRLMTAVRERGLTQVVLLAAGLDTRAFRPSWPEGVVLYELDRDDVLDEKEAVLAAIGARPACDRRVIRIDFNEEWAPTLTGAGFDRERLAAFLAEGLLTPRHTMIVSPRSTPDADG